MDRTQLLDRFRSGVAEIDAALDAITDAELDQPAPDGGWTARQVVHHLADSEARAFVRLRRLIAEDEAQIIGYDEPEYARRLHYDRTRCPRAQQRCAEDEPQIIGYDEPEYARRLHYDRPIGASLAVVRAVRAASLELLESLTPAEWERRGTHSEVGAYSVDDWLRTYASHPHDHAGQIRAARGVGVA